LAGDSLNRSWVKIDTGDTDDLGPGLLTLVIGTPGHFEVLGNAFVVYGNGQQALCLTAAHNFDRVRQITDPGGLRNYYETPPDLRGREPFRLKTDGCNAIAVVDKNPTACRIDYVSYIDGFDVAVFTARAEEDQFQFPAKFSLDLREPSVGDEVALAGSLLSQDGREPPKVIIGMERFVAQGIVT
jgi:hypothetical protein